MEGYFQRLHKIFGELIDQRLQTMKLDSRRTPWMQSSIVMSLIDLQQYNPTRSTYHSLFHWRNTTPIQRTRCHPFL